MTNTASISARPAARPPESPAPSTLGRTLDEATFEVTTLADTAVDLVSEYGGRLAESTPVKALNELPALGFLGHLYGDTMVSNSMGERLTAAAMSTYAEVTLDRIATSAASGAAVLSHSVATPLSVVSALDGFVANDSALKLITGTVAAIDPVNNISGAINAGVDSLGMLRRLATDPTTAQRQAEQFAASTLRGEYGTVVQSAVIVSAALRNDAEMLNAITSSAAEQGEFGTMVAVGNYVADEVNDLIFDSANTDPGQMVPVADAEKREAARWYAPWTW